MPILMPLRNMKRWGNAASYISVKIKRGETKYNLNCKLSFKRGFLQPLQYDAGFKNSQHAMTASCIKT